MIKAFVFWLLLFFGAILFAIGLANCENPVEHFTEPPDPGTEIIVPPYGPKDTTGDTVIVWALNGAP